MAIELERGVSETKLRDALARLTTGTNSITIPPRADNDDMLIAGAIEELVALREERDHPRPEAPADARAAEELRAAIRWLEASPGAQNPASTVPTHIAALATAARLRLVDLLSLTRSAGGDATVAAGNAVIAAVVAHDWNTIFDDPLTRDLDRRTPEQIGQARLALERAVRRLHRALDGHDDRPAPVEVGDGTPVPGAGQIVHYVQERDGRAMHLPAIVVFGWCGHGATLMQVPFDPTGTIPDTWHWPERGGDD